MHCTQDEQWNQSRNKLNPKFFCFNYDQIYQVLAKFGGQMTSEERYKKQNAQSFVPFKEIFFGAPLMSFGTIICEHLKHLVIYESHKVLELFYFVWYLFTAHRGRNALGFSHKFSFFWRGKSSRIPYDARTWKLTTIKIIWK